MSSIHPSCWLPLHVTGTHAALWLLPVSKRFPVQPNKFKAGFVYKNPQSYPRGSLMEISPSRQSEDQVPSSQTTFS